MDRLRKQWEMNKMWAKMWDEMDPKDKDKYQVEADKLMVKYEKDKADYEAGCKARAAYEAGYEAGCKARADNEAGK